MSLMVRTEKFFCLTLAFLLVLLLFAFSVVAPPPPPPPTPPPPSGISVTETGQMVETGASPGQEFASGSEVGVPTGSAPQTVEGKLALLEKQVVALREKSDYSLPVLVLFLLNIVTLILVLYILLKPQKTVPESYK